MSRKIFRLVLVALFFCSFCQGAYSAEKAGKAEEKDNRTVITIETADFTEYKKDKERDTEEIVLSGNVGLSVKKGKTDVKIKADKVSYNRATEMLFAQGNVKLIQKDANEGEQEITSATLLFNTSSLEGIFDGGKIVQTQSDAINLPSGSTLIVASDIFGRSSSTTITFKKAALTFCDDENPHWKIRASRIWLLPGGEFAFFNALLTVGKVPVMYLPAFYYPKDELIFNPSFGYSDRLGYYFQTTTYIIGRKPLETDDGSEEDEDDITKGIFNFMKPSTLKKQRREGLVLHNLEENYDGDTSSYLKFIADYYANLGVLTGFEGIAKPKNDYVSEFKISAMVGFTNTIFSSSDTYTVYDQDGLKHKDSSSFMGYDAGHRFRGELKFSLKKPFTLSLSMPLFSDPYFSEDFTERSEYLDWIGFLMSGSSVKDKDDEADSSSQTSSFPWDLNGNATIPLPDFVKPYVSNLAISSFSSNITFSAKNRSDDDFRTWSSGMQAYSPERSFFYPSQVSPFKIKAAVSGTIYSYPAKSASSSSSEKSALPFSPVMPESLMSDEEKEKALKEKDKDVDKTAGDEKKADENEEKADESSSGFVFRELDVSGATKIIDVKGTSYSLDYAIDPEYTSQITYDSALLRSPQDFSWSDIHSSYYQVKSPVKLNSTISYMDSFASMKNTFLFEPVYQTHPNLDGYKTDSEINTVRKTDYEAKKLDLTNTNGVSFKPFVFSECFNNTGIEWNTTIKMVRTKFIGDAENPEWDYLTTELWNDECVTVHTLTANLCAQEGDFSQKLALSTNLPPQLDEYTGTLTFTFPHVELAFSEGLKKESVDSDEFLWKPFQQSASLKFFDNNLCFTESYNYETEERYHDLLKLALSYKGLQLGYTQQYAVGYKAKYSDCGIFSGWVAKGDSEKEFIPYSASLAYSSQNKTYRYWKNRITWAPGLSASIVYDFVKPTSSYFRFVPSVSFKIHEQFELTFSAESQNDVIFRYFQKYMGYDGAISGETNPLKDLYNSFKFWGDDGMWEEGQTTRRASGYKIKNLKVSIVRMLHDWDMEGSLEFKPRYITNDDGKKEYDYHPYISFRISWRPMASMKTEIVDEYGEWKLNP